MGLSLQNANTLFINYERDIVDTMPMEARTHKMFQTKSWEGDFVEFPLHTRRNVGMGFGQAGSDYRQAGKQGHEKARIYRRFWDASIQLDDAIMAAAKTSAHAAKAAIDQEISGLTRDAIKFHNVFCFLDGSGKVATISGTTTVSGDAALLIDTSVGTWEGGTYEVWNAAGSVQRGTITVRYIQQRLSSGAVVLVTTAAALPAGTVATDILVWPGSLNRAFSGFLKLIDDSSVSSFQNVNTTLNPRYKATVLDGGGVPRDVTPELFRGLDAAIFQSTGRPAGNGTAIGAPAQMAKLDEMEQDQLRYRPEDTAVGMRVKSVQTSNGVTTFEPDMDCPPSRLFRVDPSQLYRYVQEEMGFVRRGGQVLFESTTSKNAVGNMREIAELAIKQRNTSGRIDDLSTDNRIVGF